MIGPVLLAAAAVFVTVVVALAAIGLLRRTSVAGIRIPSLYPSEAAWRVGHRAAVLPTAAAAAAAAAIFIVLVVVVLADPDFALTGSLLETVVLVAGVLAGTTLASRAARQQPH